ncbi:MAG TPA: hypothetical protein VF945_00750, partial [Polyangia bacterium]
MPLATTATLLLAATTLAAIVGVRIGHRLRERASERERTQMYGLQASLLGLLALLIGFSFAMAETRYDLRKQLVVDEANAIGTAWLRAGVVGDARAVEIQRLLEAYVAVRLQGYRAHEGGLRAALAESERLQREVWSRATAIARDDPRSLPASLLLQALNAVIDLHATRVAVGRNHIPTMVLATLWLVAVVTLAWVGVCAGMSGRRALTVTLLLSLLVSAVITVIVDLDQPRGGLIRV